METMPARRRWACAAICAVLLGLTTATAWADESLPARSAGSALAPVDIAAAEPSVPQRRLARARSAGCCLEPFDPCEPCDPCDPCRTRWTVGLYASGSVFEDPTGIVGEPVAGTTPLAWSRNAFDEVAGGRLRVAYRPNCEDEYEGRLLFYGTAEARSRQIGSFGSGIPPVASPRAAATLRNESVVWGLDANYWRTLSGRGRWTTRIGAGWRYMRLDEKASMREWAAPAPTAFLESDVRNTLLAAQLMAGAAWRMGRRLQLLGDAKLIGGAVATDVQITDDGLLSGGRQRTEKSETNFGWGVEATVEGRLQVARRVFVRAGYELLFLDGVQGATDAMDFTQGATGGVQPRFRSSSRLIHSVFLGLDVEF